MPVAEGARNATRPSKKRKKEESIQPETTTSNLIYSCKNLIWPDYNNHQQADKRQKLDQNENHDNACNENQNCVTFPNGLTVSTECNAFTSDSDLDLESLSEYNGDNEFNSIDDTTTVVERPRKSLMGTLFSPVFSFFYGNTETVTDATLKSYIKTNNSTGEETDNPTDLTAHETFTHIVPFSATNSLSTDRDSKVEKTTPEQLDPYYFIKHIPNPPPDLLRKTVLPLPTRRTPKMCLVLDLDETLVHCSITEIPNYDITFEVEFEKVFYTIFVRTRPHLYEFLEKVSKMYEVILFTASRRAYADKLINLIDPKREIFRHRLFREHCLYVQGNYVKDLSILGRDLQRTMIVDNTPQAFAYNISNGIPIESWFVDKNDSELLELLPFLEKLAEVEQDVRPHIRDRYRLHELLK